jgi:type III restriction enzyme
MSLKEKYNLLSEMGYISTDVPKFIEDNLTPVFKMREYQKEAIMRFIHYYNNPHLRVKPTHLLFHMATGSGKTLLMAANILYMFKEGYRNFLFFVNSVNIIEKTRDNFLNRQSPKYLFNEKIAFDGKEVQITEVPNFEVVDSDGINIIFTTIQSLHSVMNTSRENTLTYSDFNDKKIVILSDEAHHINAWTKNNLPETEKVNKNTWEHTVTSLFNSNNDNVMLEYTATPPNEQPVIEKYFNKIIYEYPLKKFRLDGYSKEVKILQADLEHMDRTLQAVIISQFRRKIADSINLQIKPVILIKSRTIKESEEFKKTFDEKIKNLASEDLEKIRNNNVGENILRKAFNFFEKEHITIGNLVEEVKEEFNENKCLLLNSKIISEENQLIVNNLEAQNNEIRVIFAVNMLNEGWDVLNLFDIVRLYNTRDAKANKPGQTTIAEAQLIGRGARYFPFKVNEDEDRYKRKFDNDTINDLRVLEELYYHSKHNSRYIQELTIALRESGIIPPSESTKINIRVKDSLKASSFWKNGFIFLNEKEQKDISKVRDLSDLDITKVFKFNIATGFVESITVFEKTEERNVDEKVSAILSFDQFDKRIIRKAIDRLDFFKFNNLIKYFPAMNSISEFITSTLELKVEISSSKSKLSNLDNEDKVKIAVFVLEKVKDELERTYTEFTGTKIFKPYKINEIVKDKTINVVINDNLSSDQEKGVAMASARNNVLRLNLAEKEWYVYDENYGTFEEKSLICFINSMMEKLKEKYSDVYLLRNESLFKIYQFSNARPTEPDFVLFVREKTTQDFSLYQLFIESKGDMLLTLDEWKQDFLIQIESKYKIETFMENEEIKIIGLPFYNEKTKSVFMNEFKAKLKLA